MILCNNLFAWTIIKIIGILVKKMEKLEYIIIVIKLQIEQMSNQKGFRAT